MPTLFILNYWRVHVYMFSGGCNMSNLFQKKSVEKDRQLFLRITNTS